MNKNLLAIESMAQQCETKLSELPLAESNDEERASLLRQEEVARLALEKGERIEVLKPILAAVKEELATRGR